MPDPEREVGLRASGIREIGDQVEFLQVPGPRPLRPDEVLIDVHASGVGNWDDIARTGGWDVGAEPPTALGVEAAGVVAAIGNAVAGIRAGDRVTAHSVPLREQGSWAEKFIAAAGHTARVPPGLPLDAAAALPIPALTADQVIGDALRILAGETVLVHGAGGVTGGMLVQLACHQGAFVIATASGHNFDRVRALGAGSVLDYHEPDWPGQVRSVTGGGADAAANAARSGALDAMKAVRDGGRVATITGDPPPAERAITVLAVQVVPDGARLQRLTRLAAQGEVTVSIADRYPLADADQALARVKQGTHGQAVILTVSSPD